MTNQEIALEITKILKPDIDLYTRHHNDGDRFETRKRVYAETYLYFLKVSRMNGVDSGIGPSSNVRYTEWSFLSILHIAFGYNHLSHLAGCSMNIGIT